jgi:hypothetical protein
MVSGGFCDGANFSGMTKAELRAYVVAHSNDREAFHAFVDRFTVDAPSETYDIPRLQTEIAEVERLIRKKLAQRQ